MACNSAPFCSRVMPRGRFTLILPLGPCTSILSGPSWIFTPAGTAIGFLPIRDMVSVLSCQTFPERLDARYQTAIGLLPDLAQHFAANMRFARRAAGHHALGR